MLEYHLLRLLKKTIHQYRKTDNWCCSTQKKNEDKVNISYVFFFFFLFPFSRLLFLGSFVRRRGLDIIALLIEHHIPNRFCLWGNKQKKHWDTSYVISSLFVPVFLSTRSKKKKLGTVSVILFSFYS